MYQMDNLINENLSWNEPFYTYSRSPRRSVCEAIVNTVCYSHNAAISLGRSAPNWPKRWLLASRSKGEWLLMELKVKGYMARAKPVMWRIWCSLLVAIVKSAAGGSGGFSPAVSCSRVFVRGLWWVWDRLVPFSLSRVFGFSLLSRCREVRAMLKRKDELDCDRDPGRVTKSGSGQDSIEKKEREAAEVQYWNQSLVTTLRVQWLCNSSKDKSTTPLLFATNTDASTTNSGPETKMTMNKKRVLQNNGKADFSPGFCLSSK